MDVIANACRNTSSIVTTISILCQNKLALIGGIKYGGQNRDWNSALCLPPPGLNDLLYCLSQQHPHVGGELNLVFHRHWEITDQAYQERCTIAVNSFENSI